MQEYPDAGTKELRGKIPAVFTWLYRNDKIWLEEHLPVKNNAEKRQPYIDWASRDNQLAQAVKEAATYLKMLPSRPVRVSFASISRIIGQLALLQQHLDKLPLTAKALTEAVETREMFAVRKILWTTERYREEHIYPARWPFIKRAGVERLITQPLIRETIDAELSTFV